MKIAATFRTLLLAASLVFPTYGIAETAADYNNRGIAKVAKGDFDGAIADYGRALELDPKFAAAYNNRGMAKLRKDLDFDGAFADFNRALELDPKFAAAYNYRGIAKVVKGDFDGAIAEYNRALELDPKFAAAYRRRGIAKQAKSDFDGAIADYDRAVEFDPKFALSYADRGISHLSSRHWSEALKDFNHFFDLSKDEQDFPRLFVWMITVQLNGADAANKDLTAYLDGRSNAAAGDWFSKVAGHVLGKVTQADLFAAAKSPDIKKERGQLCEAWFFSGMKKLLGGDKTAAADHFQKCLATEQQIFVEYQFAQMELKSLKQ
jgi:lipoprotein NlpI